MSALEPDRLAAQRLRSTAASVGHGAPTLIRALASIQDESFGSQSVGVRGALQVQVDEGRGVGVHDEVPRRTRGREYTARAPGGAGGSSGRRGPGRAGRSEARSFPPGSGPRRPASPWPIARRPGRGVAARSPATVRPTHPSRRTRTGGPRPSRSGGRSPRDRSGPAGVPGSHADGEPRAVERASLSRCPARPVESR